MKGHKFLKVTGILMIIAAAFSIIAGVLVGGLGALAAGVGAASGLTFAYWAALFLTLVGGICQLWGDRIFEKCGIGRDEGGDSGKTLEIRGKRRLSARDGGANYQQS